MNKKLHYFYRVAEDTEVGKQLKDFMKQCNEAAETARQWVERQGADHFYESPNGMAGGVAAVEFDTAVNKEGWERMETPDGHAYFVPQEDSAIEREMYALPIVSEFALIPILSFKSMPLAAAARWHQARAGAPPTPPPRTDGCGHATA